MLAQALNSGREVVCFREVFNYTLDFIQYGVEGYDDFSAEDRALREEAPLLFLDERVFCRHPDKIKAARLGPITDGDRTFPIRVREGADTNRILAARIGVTADGDPAGQRRRRHVANRPAPRQHRLGPLTSRDRTDPLRARASSTGGGAVRVQPVGVLEVDGDETRRVPILDWTRIITTGLTAFGIWMVFRTIFRRR